MTFIKRVFADLDHSVGNIDMCKRLATFKRTCTDLGQAVTLMLLYHKFERRRRGSAKRCDFEKQNNFIISYKRENSKCLC